MSLLDCTCEPLGGIHEPGCVSQRLRQGPNPAPDAQQPTQEPAAGPEPGNEPSGAAGAPQTARNPHEPPAHIQAAGQVAKLMHNAPNAVRVDGFPAGWPLVHSGRDNPEGYAFAQQTLTAFLGFLCGFAGFRLEAIDPEELALIRLALYQEHRHSPDVRYFAVAVQSWLALQILRIQSARAEAEAQSQAPRLLTPGDPGFHSEGKALANREQRRAAKRGGRLA